MLRFSRILCPTDFSESSRQALKYAKALSAWYDARFTVLHVCVDLPVFEMTSPLGHSVSATGMLEESQLAERRAAVRQFVASEVGEDGVEMGL